MVLRLLVVRTILATPPLPCLVPDEVFDGFGWSVSHSLEWRRGAGWSPTSGEAITSTNPAGMVFVLRESCSFLPQELARLHAPGLGLTSEQALAPYGIDDATDELFLRGVPPESLLWLVANDLPGLVWGLHDWSHFHNHGPFEARAMTELQCDAAALVWLWLNHVDVGVTDSVWEETRVALSRVAASRFREEGGDIGPDWLSAGRLIELARSAAREG
jgi:hypothetical protein